MPYSKDQVVRFVPPPRRISEEEGLEILKLRAKGLVYREISEITGRPLGTICRYCVHRREKLIELCGGIDPYDNDTSKKISKGHCIFSEEEIDTIRRLHSKGMNAADICRIINMDREKPVSFSAVHEKIRYPMIYENKPVSEVRLSSAPRRLL